MRVALVSGVENSVGRTYCLWLLSEELGWEGVPLLPGPIWPPLETTEFAARSRPLANLRRSDLSAFDAVIAHQPLPETLGLVLSKVGEGVPVVVDIDELAWEQRYGYTGAQRSRVSMAMMARRRDPRPYRFLRRWARRRQSLISSPALLPHYPGTVVPHVRPPSAMEPWPDDSDLKVCFVGTVRKTKGLPLLREAVRSVPGVRLTVTADPPPDATANETWTGALPFDEAMGILARSHAAVVPSDDSRWSQFQFPVKLVDAMLAGRAIVASDLPPIAWATSGAALLVRPGDLGALVAALQQLRDDRVSAKILGMAGRERALERFVPSAVAGDFASALEQARKAAAGRV